MMEIGPGRSLSIAAAVGNAGDRRKAVALPPMALNSLNEVNDQKNVQQVDSLLQRDRYPSSTSNCRTRRRGREEDCSESLP